MKTLKNTDNIKFSLKIKISDYERRLNENEQQLSLAKSDYNQCTEKLNTLQALLTVKAEHEKAINNLQK